MRSLDDDVLVLCLACPTGFLKIFTTEYTEGTGEISLLKPRERLLPGIVQAGGDAVHGGSDGVIESGIERRIGSACALAAQQIDLNQAERIDIRVAQTHGSQDDGILFQ